MSQERNGGETLFDLLVHNSVDGLASIDRDYRYTLWNRAMERFAGKTSDEVMGRNAFEVFPFLRKLGLDVAIDRALSGEVVTAEAVPDDLPDGTRRYYDRLYLPLRAGDARILGVLAIVRDVTAKRNAEDALRANEEQLHLAVYAARVGLWRWNVRANTLLWEDPLCAIFGIPPATAPRTREEYIALIHPEDRQRSVERVARGVVVGHWEDEYRILRSDGAVRWVFAKGSLVGDVALGALIDITDRRQREDQLRQAQKLEAVGQLTAGIAHNFNNMLMGILPNLSMAAKRVPSDLVTLIQDAEQAAERAAALVRQLMTYAGRDAPAVRTVQPLARLVERTVAFCRTTFDQRIEVETRCDVSACALIDAVQVEQALLNVLINARDAVAEVEKPRVMVALETVRAGATELGEDHVGDWVCVRIEDNGDGMDAETIAHIYEPFFTTKAIDKGTGLGLATTRAIVVEHGGFIACHSARREGAKFSLYFPRQPAPQVAPSDAVAHPTPGGAQGTEVVLVVDDEPAVRRIVAAMLRDAGFRVTVAGSGEEALERLADAGLAADLDLVILDVSMPGLSGHELRNRIRALAPEARVLFFSGYAFDAPDSNDAVLEKPATERQLLEKVRAVLDRPAVGDGTLPR
jgi:two-component system, cell cycle sensor histidine kinase and response regulator CckA